VGHQPAYISSIEKRLATPYVDVSVHSVKCFDCLRKEKMSARTLAGKMFVSAEFTIVPKLRQAKPSPILRAQKIGYTYIYIGVYNTFNVFSYSEHNFRFSEHFVPILCIYNKHEAIFVMFPVRYSATRYATRRYFLL